MTDRWGLDVTIPDLRHDGDSRDDLDSPLDRFERLLIAYLTLSADIPAQLIAAITTPAAPLARIAAGYLFVQAHTVADHRRAAEIVQHLEALLVGDPGLLNERERAHLGALTLIVAGQTDAAADAFDALLAKWPTDLLAVRLAHFVLFNRGRLDDMLASVVRSSDAWGDLPFRSYLDGMRAFTLEEMGEYRQAEAIGRAAVEVDPTDLWSVHAVVHVLEMEARTAEGVAWFEARDDQFTGAFARHLWWHHAIIHLRTGDHRRLLELYDTRVQPGQALDGLSLTNAIDGLARLEFAGVDVGDRWTALLDAAQYRIGYHDHPFNDSHYAYALVRAGAPDRARDLLDGMAAWRERGTTAAGVIELVGLDTATAMAALAGGDHSTAASLLSQRRGDRWQLGGSHAQRRLFDLAEQFAQASGR